MTRRDFLTGLFPSRRSVRRTAPNIAATSAPSDAPQVAVIAGRHCLAYQGSFCSTCRERCPVDGAIVIERGLPRVNSELCNGCRLCHELCPAPTNAILMLGRSASPAPARRAPESHDAPRERIRPLIPHA